MTSGASRLGESLAIEVLDDASEKSVHLAVPREDDGGHGRQLRSALPGNPIHESRDAGRRGGDPEVQDGLACGRVAQPRASVLEEVTPALIELPGVVQGQPN